MRNHGWWMMLCCLLPLFFIFLLPVAGVKGDSSLFFFVIMIRGDYESLRNQLAKNALFSWLIKTRDHTASQGRFMTVDFAKPASFKTLNEFIATHGQNFIPDLEQYEGYYQRMVEASPKMAEGYAMLGFCQYNLGKTAEAIDSFKKAIELNPYLFAVYYDLGVIYFKQTAYAQSIRYLTKAIEITPAITYKIVHVSKIYQDLLVDPRTHEVTTPEFNKSYTDAYKLLVADAYFLDNTIAVNTIAQHALESSLEDSSFFQYYATINLEKDKGQAPQLQRIQLQIF